MIENMVISMNVVFSDFRHALRSPWFALSTVALVFSLWLDLGTDSYWLLHGGPADAMLLLKNAMCGAGSILSLPLLSALPCSANAYQELSNGSARMAIFRCGRPVYIFSKLLCLLCMTLLSQAIGILLFTRILLFFCPHCTTPFPYLIFLSRLLAAMFFSTLGGVSALLAKDSVSACAIPTSFSFSLSLLASRFFIATPGINPLSWLSGEPEMLLLLRFILTAVSLLYVMILRLEMNQYV